MNKKAWSPVLSLPIPTGPKVEKCLAYLLPHPPGEDIPTIWKKKKTSEREKDSVRKREQSKPNSPQLKRGNKYRKLRLK